MVFLYIVYNYNIMHNMNMNKKYLMALLLLFVIAMSIYNTHVSEKEPFTPYIRKMYRPYIRNARVTVEDFIGKKKTSLQNMLRKVGIM